MSKDCCPLRIDVYMANGEMIEFVQDDPALVRQILDDLHKQRLFTEPRVTIASIASITSFATHDIEFMKFHFCGPDDFHPILGMEDIREVTRAEFESAFLSLPVHERLKWREVHEGEQLTAYTEAHFRSGNVLVLELTMKKRSPRDHMICFRDAFQLPMLPFHVIGGGWGVINTAVVTRLTAFPGPSMCPPAAWRAEPGT